MIKDQNFHNPDLQLLRLGKNQKQKLEQKWEKLFKGEIMKRKSPSNKLT